MAKLDHDDYRRPYSTLSDEVLCRLLQYTFSRARPVLVWELNLERIEIPVGDVSLLSEWKLLRDGVLTWRGGWRRTWRMSEVWVVEGS